LTYARVLAFHLLHPNCADSWKKTPYAPCRVAKPTASTGVVINLLFLPSTSILARHYPNIFTTPTQYPHPRTITAPHPYF